MTPDQLQAVAALATILKAVGSLPFGAVLGDITRLERELA